jgi:hypothetical protein
MHMIGHDHGGMQIDSPPVVMYAMRENEMACSVGERIVDEFAEGHKDRVTWLLVVWHAPPIFVFAAERRMVGHDLLKTRTMALSVTGVHPTSSLSSVERTLLSAAFDFDFGFLADLGNVKNKIKINSKIKGGGQECPPYMGLTRPL